MTEKHARALTGLAAAALLVAGCETAFVGRGPAGRYELVGIDGRPPPQVVDPRHDCPTTVASGHFDLDAVARRFALVLEQRSPCMAGGGTTSRVTGSYLRRGSRLDLETADGGRLAATESGDSLSLNYYGSRLRFRQAGRPR